jgi:hypothetical protein
VAGEPLEYRQPEKQGRFDWFEWLVLCAVGGVVLYGFFLVVILFLVGPD